MFTFGGGRIDPPTLLFPKREWDRLRTYVQLCPEEINGFGLIEYAALNVFAVSEIYILEQNVTGGSAEIDPVVMARHRYQLTQEGTADQMRLQWHSHVSMDAYFSGTDLGQIESYNDWMISLVTNKHGDFSVRLDLFMPFRMWVPMEIKIADVPATELVDEVQADITSLVHSRSWLGFRRTPPMQSVRPYMLDAANVVQGGQQ